MCELYKFLKNWIKMARLHNQIRNSLIQNSSNTLVIHLHTIRHFGVWENKDWEKAVIENTELEEIIIDFSDDLEENDILECFRVFARIVENNKSLSCLTFRYSLWTEQAELFAEAIKKLSLIHISEPTRPY